LLINVVSVKERETSADVKPIISAVVIPFFMFVGNSGTTISEPGSTFGLILKNKNRLLFVEIPLGAFT
jgi:hypothetical protein